MNLVKNVAIVTMTSFLSNLKTCFGIFPILKIVKKKSKLFLPNSHFGQKYVLVKLSHYADRGPHLASEPEYGFVPIAPCSVLNSRNTL